MVVIPIDSAGHSSPTKQILFRAAPDCPIVNVIVEILAWQLSIFLTRIYCLAQPVASCAMPVMKGMKIKTDSPITRKAR